MFRLAVRAAPLFAVAGARSASAQELPANAPVVGDTAHVASVLSSYEFYLTIIVVLFGAAVLFTEYLLLRRIAEKKTDELIRTLTVTLIIFSTLILITAGYSNDQIAPALGLFGTIAGYLLGRNEARTSSSDSEKAGGKAE